MLLNPGSQVHLFKARGPSASEEVDARHPGSRSHRKCCDRQPLICLTYLRRPRRDRALAVFVEYLPRRQARVGPRGTVSGPRPAARGRLTRTRPPASPPPSPRVEPRLATEANTCSSALSARRLLGAFSCDREPRRPAGRTVGIRGSRPRLDQLGSSPIPRRAPRRTADRVPARRTAFCRLVIVSRASITAPRTATPPLEAPLIGRPP